ncbi:oxalate--CoA ligase [Trichomonascus vanleenenianus]|uniref:Pcs60p n=1 Tax=Trichomonascus vanleenenianus TaxID=2268995 RepID=UPI003ECA6E5F
MSTFYEQLVAHQASPKKAVSAPDTGVQLSFGEYLRAVQSFQRNLSGLGLPKNAAVSLALVNGLEFAVAFVAIAFSSYIAAPLNPAYKVSEFEFYIEDIKSAVVFVPEGAVAKNHAAVQAARNQGAGIVEVGWSGLEATFRLVEPGKQVNTARGTSTVPPPPKPDQTAFVLHTSGTTGRPKAVPLTHLNMATTVRNIINTYKLSPADTSYLVMPLFHVHGLLCGFLAALGAGGAVVVPPRFSAHAFWPDFIRYGCNWYTAVPTIHQILLKSPLPPKMPQIRFIRSCSSALAPSVFHSLEKTFNAPVLEAYAMTEACHQMTSNNLPPGKRKPGTVGVGQGVEVAILDADGNDVPQGQEGEISIKGKNVTPGYINNPKANQESFTSRGFFRTGDQGKLDEDGFVIITGRIKELINRGGEKISPIELDGVMLSHPSVAEAVAFAAPDEMYGQQVNAAIVLKPGKESTTEKDIQDFLASKISKFKIPQRIFFTDVMPKTATGKIQRRNIAAKFLGPEPKAKL